jgi:hypothetical protein
MKYGEEKQEKSFDRYGELIEIETQNETFFLLNQNC